MNTQFLIFIITMVLFCLLFVTWPLKIKQLKQKSGALQLSLKNGDLVRTILILVFSLILICFTIIRNFSPISQSILSACGLLGEFMALGDLAYKGKNGVYDNGILVNGNFTAFDDITSFPILQLPEEEQAKYSKNLLEVTTSKKGKVVMIFTGEEEGIAATEKMFELRPDLKAGLK